MIKKLSIAVLTFFMISSISMAGNAKDIKLPDGLKAGSSDLLLNGSGIRTKKIGFMTLDLYVAGLYLSQKNTNVDIIADTDEAMAIKLHITSKLITGKRMTKATNEGFEKATGGNTTPIKTEIDEMMSVFKGKIKIGDVYDFIYSPREGTEILMNGQVKTTVKGLEFKKALFGIWLGNEPIQKELKTGMAGA